MTANGHQPTAEDVSAAFGAAGDFGPAHAEGSRAESERAILGAMIQSGDAAREATALLRSDHFAVPSHQLVFEAIERLLEAGNPVEPASVLAELAAAGTLTKVGDKRLGTAGPYLHSLIQRAGQVGYHAKRVLGEWQRWDRLLLALKQCEQIVRSDGWDPDEHLDAIRQRVMDATAFAGAGAVRPNSEAVAEVLDSLEHEVDPGLSTGYPDLDDAIGGLRPGELIVIGARPGTGKTLAGLCIADYVASRLKLPVLFASLEMREDELTKRRIAAVARVPLVSIVRHQVSDADWHLINRASERLLETELRIDDASSQSPARIRGKLREMERTGGAARLLVIDYLGYLAAPKAESRQQAVAELVRQVKNIAREHDIPVILLAQLNRGPEHRSDKRPMPSDLRETGEAEQSADIAILLHREDAYQPDSPRAGEIDLVIAKNRQGPLCTVTLAFQGHYGRIVSMSSDREWSPSSAIGDRK